MNRVDQLLRDWQTAKDPAVFDELFRLLYEDLRRLAHAQRRRWSGNVTLDTSALVHNAFIRLRKSESVDARFKPQFMSLVARVFRNDLINYAKAAQAQKRGGDSADESLDETNVLPRDESPDIYSIMTLDQILKGMAETDPESARVLELYYFGGYKQNEIASIIEKHEATVRRCLRRGEALLRRLSDTPLTLPTNHEESQ